MPEIFSIQPTASGGLIVESDSEWAKFRVEWDAAGKLVSESAVMRKPDVEARLEAEGYDPSTLKRSGCCDPPAQSV